MRHDDRQVMVTNTTVGNDWADCNVPSRYLPQAKTKKVSFFILIILVSTILFIATYKLKEGGGMEIEDASIIDEMVDDVPLEALIGYDEEDITEFECRQKEF